MVSTQAGQAHIHRPDPEDDRRPEPTMPSGSTSKTWDLRADSKFWHRKSTDEDPGSSSSSMSSTQQRPGLRAEKDLSSQA